MLAAYSAAIDEVVGRPAEPVGFHSWADSAITHSAGIPTIMCGATGGDLHAIDEWVNVSSVGQLVAILEISARRHGTETDAADRRCRPSSTRPR